MKPLRPTLWRTCRVLANTTRLRLLWRIFKSEGLCVGALARAAGTSRENATIQLRALSSRGLITPERVGRRVVYRAVANPGVDGAEELLAALQQSVDDKVPPKTVFRTATAFTQARRIALMKLILESGGSLETLCKRSGLRRAVLQWNLSKLEARGFVREKKGFYQAAVPNTRLAKCLIKLIDKRQPPQCGEL